MYRELNDSNCNSQERRTCSNLCVLPIGTKCKHTYLCLCGDTKAHVFATHVPLNF